MKHEEAEFVIYIINEIANIKGCSTSKIYQSLIKSECISKYLVAFYDVLHTMSTSMVVEDVFKYLEKRGVQI